MVFLSVDSLTSVNVAMEPSTGVSMAAAAAVAAAAAAAAAKDV